MFLACGAATIVIVAHSPFGMKEVQERLMSSVIGASRFDVILYASLLTTAVIAICFVARPLLLVLVDREMAAACGISPRVWEVCLAIAVGLVVGIVLRGMGILLTFGSLILPCAIAKGFCREARSLFWVAPLVAVAAAVLGFLVGNHWDFPQGPLTVVILGAALPLALIAGRIRGNLQA
jgi:ABC-type Mn2+/Zn2+ transport system permease subunit